MGREVRMVPANWEHPKNAAGHYIPLYGWSFAKRDREWVENAAKWADGVHPDQVRDPSLRERFPKWEDWDGKRPNADDYMPDWPESERTHYMMYEDTSEGTPISPAFVTPEELARWLADNGASAFGGMGASYEGWLSTIKRGSAPSMIIAGGVMQSGVDAMRGTTPSESDGKENG